jgi:hypothetical protein
LLIVDEYTGMKWSLFLQFKSDLADALLQFLDERWDEGMRVQCIRMDNAGENIKLVERMHTHERYIGIKIEFTSPHVLQLNGVVERAFPSILGRVRAMMLGAKFDRNMKERMWAEAINTATLLDNATSKDDSGCARVKLYEKNYSWVPNLREFGELAELTVATNNKGKLEHRGVIGMFVGYCNNHPSDTYRFINLDKQY